MTTESSRTAFVGKSETRKCPDQCGRLLGSRMVRVSAAAQPKGVEGSSGGMRLSPPPVTVSAAPSFRCLYHHPSLLLLLAKIGILGNDL